jgi:glycosyltransferase involved in cell wall biosynthesis
MKPRVLLVSTVHPAEDPRLAFKIAPSLAENYEVIFFAPRTDSSAVSGIRSISLPFFKRLFWRVVFCHPRILWQGLLLRPAILHIFVPELIPVAMIFNWAGARVIYEVQENMFKKFAIKRYNDAWIFQFLFRIFDAWARQVFRVVVTETAYLNEYNNLRFEPTIIRNFVSLPFIDLHSSTRTNTNGVPVFLYIGVISMERCFDTLIAALVLLRQTHPVFYVELFGPLRFDLSEAHNLPGFDTISPHLVFHGYTDHREILPNLKNVVLGLALLKPVADYPDSYPAKLFEYMALGLPVVTSDFSLYKRVVEEAACGFCIDPSSPEQLAQVMREILNKPDEAFRLGNAGRKAVEENYNWESEKKILLELYSKTAGTETDKSKLATDSL